MIPYLNISFLLILFILSTTKVIAVKLNDNPKALYEIPKKLGDHEINIDFCYSTSIQDDSLLILRVEDDIIEQTSETLEQNGFMIVKD